MIKKICLILFIFIMIFSVYPNNSNAAADFVKDADNFVNIGRDNMIDRGILQSVSENLYNVFLSIGIITAVIIAAILGIKFMVGSVEVQAKVKESLIPFIVGCVVIFGAFGIWKIIVTLGNSFLG